MKIKNNVSLLFRKYSQFIKFGLVGFSNTLISYVTYALLVYLDVYYQIANIVAFTISSLSGFVLNRSWVFDGKNGHIVKQLLKYYLVYGSSLILSLVLTYIWIELVGVNKYLPPIINLIITVPYNYLLNKVWAFRMHKGTANVVPDGEFLDAGNANT